MYCLYVLFVTTFDRKSLIAKFAVIQRRVIVDVIFVVLQTRFRLEWQFALVALVVFVCCVSFHVQFYSVVRAEQTATYFTWTLFSTCACRWWVFSALSLGKYWLQVVHIFPVLVRSSSTTFGPSTVTTIFKGSIDLERKQC